MLFLNASSIGSFSPIFVNCLKKSPEWSSGIVHVTKEQVHRNDENIVTKILF